MRAWVMRPRLAVSINVTQPDCIKIPITKYDPQGREILSTESYYFRLKVSNDGNAKAELVEVFGKELLEQQADGSFRQANWFQPMRLAWVPDRKPVASVIVPKTYKHCNLGHIIYPEKRSQYRLEDKKWPNIEPEKTVLSLDTEVMPNNLSHLIPPGKYRLTIVLAAANSKPVEKTLAITLTGEWYMDIQRMFEKGIGINLV